MRLLRSRPRTRMGSSSTTPHSPASVTFSGPFSVPQQKRLHRAIQSFARRQPLDDRPRSRDNQSRSFGNAEWHVLARRVQFGWWTFAAYVTPSPSAPRHSGPSESSRVIAAPTARQLARQIERAGSELLDRISDDQPAGASSLQTSERPAA